jgi:hypothetical protein
VRGGADDDYCFGARGADAVFGEAGDDVLSGGLAVFSPTAGVQVGTVSDESYDDLYGGAGPDLFWVGDPRWLRPRLDDAVDESSEDTTNAEHVFAPANGFSSTNAYYPIRWGHLFGT